MLGRVTRRPIRLPPDATRVFVARATMGTASTAQPAQRSLVLDERRVPADDLPLGNLMRGVVGFEQSRSPADLARVAVALGNL